MVLCLVTLTFDLLTQNKRVFMTHGGTFLFLAASFFRYRVEKQTNSQTPLKTLAYPRNYRRR